MKTEITSDGKVVWVNNPTCIGRYCKHSGEVFDTHGKVLSQTEPIWEKWLAKMLFYHNIKIPSKHKIPNQPYRITTKIIGVRTNYLLQELRTDAPQPYYLTLYVYYFSKKARTGLKHVMETGKVLK